MDKKNIDGIHLIRCVAAFLVILVHGGLLEFSTVDSLGKSWWAANVYNCIGRGSVPLFFIATGFLLLDRANEDIFAFYYKSAKRLLLPLIFFSYLFYLNPLNPPLTNLKMILLGPVAMHLWYVYCIVGLYLLIPFLRIFVAAAPRKYLYVFVGICFVCETFIPLVQAFTPLKAEWVKTYDLSFFTGNIIYLVIGYLLKTSTLELRTLHRVLLWFVFLLLSATVMVLTWLHTKATGVHSEILGGVSPPIVLWATVLFLLLKDIRLPEGWRAKVITVSSCSYGIYLIHLFVMSKVFNYPPTSFRLIHNWIDIPLFAVLVFGVSFAIIHTLKRFKFLHPVLG